jgi:hypothetical protein
MGSFRYWREPVCAAACLGYAVNRWLLKPFLEVGPFLHGYFADVLLIPAALPLVLWIQRRLGWRTHDGPPNIAETALHLGVWSFIAEVGGPLLTQRGTADWWDVVAYFAGGLVCYVFWQRREIPCEQPGIPVSHQSEAP